MLLCIIQHKCLDNTIVIITATVQAKIFTLYACNSVFTMRCIMFSTETRTVSAMGICILINTYNLILPQALAQIMLVIFLKHDILLRCDT